MEHLDKVLLEQNFISKNMEENERNFYINLLLHSKDVCDSDIYINKHGLSHYELSFLNLENMNGLVRFEGVTYNEYENRMISGVIFRRLNKYFIKTNVYRCNDFLLDDDNEYSVYDEFIFKDSKVFRRSRYEHESSFCESEVILLSDEEMESYLQDKVNVLKRKK